MRSLSVPKVPAEVVTGNVPVGSGYWHQPGPEILPITTNIMSLRSFVEKAPDADLLREMIGFAARPRIGLPGDTMSRPTFSGRGWGNTRLAHSIDPFLVRYVCISAGGSAFRRTQPTHIWHFPRALPSASSLSTGQKDLSASVRSPEARPGFRSAGPVTVRSVRMTSGWRPADGCPM